MTKEFDLLVFIGRFQPYHVEHHRVIATALEKSKHVLVLVGSAGSSRTIRNPFTFEERKRMISSSFDVADISRIIIKPIYDKTYNDTAWIKQIQDVATSVALDVGNPSGFKANGMSDLYLGLIGAEKDHTSYYLKMFPQWDSVNVPIEDPLHATEIREHYIDGTTQRYQVHSTQLSSPVCDFLFDEFIYTNAYTQLQKELDHVRSYKKSWTAAPYPVKHVTCDAVVELGGHILLVKRRAEPGKGLWAIPGGHLNEYETLVNGVIRELKEETKIKVPEAVLRGSIIATKMFDDPYRSTLGRVITHAAHIKLNGTVLPKIN